VSFDVGFAPFETVEILDIFGDILAMRVVKISHGPLIGRRLASALS
jgi:hypothetical protein